MAKASFEAAAFLSILLRVWEGQGHQVGVDQHLRVWHLLKDRPEFEPHELKLLLAPVLGYNSQLQASFYKVFDDALEIYQLERVAHEERIQEIATQRFFEGWRARLLQLWPRLRSFAIHHPFRLLAILAMLVGAVFAWRWWNDTDFRPDIRIPIQYSEQPRENLIRVELGGPLGREDLKIKRKSRQQGKADVQLTHSKPFLLFSVKGLKMGSEKIRLELCGRQRQCVELNVEVQVGRFPKLGPKSPPAYLQNPQIPVNIDRRQVPRSDRERMRDLLKMQNLRTRIGEDNDTLGPMPFQQLEEEPDTALFRYHPTTLATGDRTYLTVKPGFSSFSKEKAVFLIVLAGLLLLLGWWLRYRRRKVMLSYTNRQGPYHWLMRIPGKPRLSLDRYFYRALAAFKARDAYSSNRLDVEETVESTIRKGGSIQLAFQEIHKQQQFLLLIDLNCTHHHRRKTFELLIDELIAEEAPIQRYYFSGDPRVCWEKSVHQLQSLATLSHRHGSSALLIYSDGQRMLDYRSGRLAAWTKIFSRWRQRLLLLPEWSENLGRHEEQLSESFRIVPANTQGLAEAVSVLEALNISKHRKFRQQFAATATPLRLPEGLQTDMLFTVLNSYLLSYDAEQRVDDSLVRWIAACAIPAAPFWEWTLLVGRELEAMEARPICTLANLEMLNRLPWLAENRIPEAYRTALVDWLEEHYPVFCLRMRQRWDEVLSLQENLPPIDSLAWNDHHLALIVNRLFQPDMEKQERQKLEQELEQLLHGQQVQ
ncbi:MAG: hypothetical protein AAFN81_12020, partial [Bacteroidota bacterium]